MQHYTRKRQLEAENAQRETQIQFKDATLRRLALESKAMFDGARAGNQLTALRIALAGLAIEPRSDQFGTLQAAVAAGDMSLRAWDVPKVSAVGYSPDGRLIATAAGIAASSSRLQFWRADNGVPVGAPIPLGDYVTGLTFSNDGARVITSDTNGTISQWDVASRRSAAPPSRIAGEWVWLRQVSVSPSGALATGFLESPGFALWSAAGNGFVPRVIRGHTDAVAGLAFSADGARIVSGSHDRSVRLWDARTGQPIGEPLLGHTEWVTSVAFSPDGQTIASSSHDKTIRLWRVGRGAVVESLVIRDAGTGIDRVVFSPDGQRVAAAAQDGFIRIWDARTGQAHGPAMTGHVGKVRDVAFAPDGERLVSIGDDDTVRLWDGRGNVHTTLLLKHEAQVNSIAFAPGAANHRLAATDFDGAVRQWDADTGNAVGATILVTRMSLNAVVYSADGRHLVTASVDGVVRVWDAETGRAALPPLRGHGVRANAVAVSGDGRLLASGDDSGQVILWDATTGQLIRRFGLLRDRIWSVGFSPDGRRLAASGAKGLFAAWDTASGQLIFQTPEDANSAFSKLAYSPDGRYVATADRRQYVVRLWDARDGRPIERRFAGHRLGVEAVAFSPDGRFLAAGGGDKSVRLWDVENGEPIGAPVASASDGWVFSIAFSPDGQRLAAGSNSQNAIQVWDGPAAWALLLCKRLTRNMSDAEWRQHVGKDWPYRKQCPNLPIPKE